MMLRQQLTDILQQEERMGDLRRIRRLLAFMGIVLTIQLCMLAFGQMWDTPLGLFSINLPLGMTAFATFFVRWRLKGLFGRTSYRILLAVPAVTLVTPLIIVRLTQLLG